jgi:hypothetical protein
MSSGEEIEVAAGLEMGWSYAPIEPWTLRSRNECLLASSSNDLNAKADKVNGRQRCTQSVDTAGQKTITAQGCS